LFRLFPNLQSLSIIMLSDHYFNVYSLFALLDQWKPQLTTLSLDFAFPATKVARLCDRINAMPSLKHLYLGQNIEKVRPQRYLTPTLSRLERLAIDSSTDKAALLPPLNPNCTHLWLGTFCNSVTDSHLCQSFRANR